MTADATDPALSLTSTTHCDPYLFDTTHYESLLDSNANRLFVPEGELQVKVVEVGHKDYIFTNEADLQAYLRTSAYKGSRLILVPQRYSWDRLTISENGIRLLISHFKIFPAIVDVLCAFGKSTSPSNDSLGGCYRWERAGIKEFCCLLKNVEKHGRTDSDEPWSIRQLGLYHQRDENAESDTFILLNPMVSFQQRLKDAQFRTGAPPTQLDIFMLAFSHTTWQWRWYLNFWDLQLGQLVSKAHVSQVKKNSKMPILTIEYSDFQDIQVIHDRMNMAKYILGANVRVCEGFQSATVNPKVDLLLEELRLQRTRADNLLERTRSGSGLMQDIISFRALDALKTSSENSNEMARLADMDSKNMVKLTSKSQRDARQLTKITILTMVYLPASFVAQFLSMGYLQVDSAKHPASLNFASEMWIFAVLTFILFALTFGLWLCLDPPKVLQGFHRRRAPRQKPVGEKV